MTLATERKVPVVLEKLYPLSQSLFALWSGCRFSGVEKLKDKAAVAAQAILEPGIATDGGQQMSRQQFGTFVRRFAAASGLSFSVITDFLLVVPVFDYDPAFMDPGEPGPSCTLQRFYSVWRSPFSLSTSMW